MREVGGEVVPSWAREPLVTDGYGGWEPNPMYKPPNLEPGPYDNNPVVEASSFALNDIDLYLHTRCQYRCEQCFLSDDQLANGEFMSMDMIDEIMAWRLASAPSGKFLRYSFTLLGGEPTIHPEFVDIVKNLYKHDWGVNVVTNGGSGAFVDAIEANRGLLVKLNSVSLSIDGPDAETNDSIRNRGAFDEQMRLATYLRRSKTNFGVNFTALKSTLSSARDMMELTHEIGARRLNVHFPTFVGRAAIHAVDEVPQPDEWQAFVEEFDAIRRESKFAELGLDVQLGYPLGRDDEDLSMCAVRSRSNLQIFPNGDAISCGLLAEHPDQGGYVFTNGSLRLRNEPDDELSIVNTGCEGSCPLKEQGDPCIYNRTSYGTSANDGWANLSHAGGFTADSWL